VDEKRQAEGACLVILGRVPSVASGPMKPFWPVGHLSAYGENGAFGSPIPCDDR